MSEKSGKPVTQRQLRVGEMIKQSLGMIFVRNDKGSHNPYEAMDVKDFMAGLSILKKFIIDY